MGVGAQLRLTVNLADDRAIGEPRFGDVTGNEVDAGEVQLERQGSVLCDTNVVRVNLGQCQLDVFAASVDVVSTP